MFWFWKTTILSTSFYDEYGIFLDTDELTIYYFSLFLLFFLMIYVSNYKISITVGPFTIFCFFIFCWDSKFYYILLLLICNDWDKFNLLIFYSEYKLLKVEFYGFYLLAYGLNGKNFIISFCFIFSLLWLVVYEIYLLFYLLLISVIGFSLS